MYIVGLERLLLLVILIPPLVYLQRFLQREIQSIFLLLTRRPEISIALFSLLFLPGVLLHEISHYFMAHLLRVRTGKFSLIPKKMGNGQLQLGYVETASTDFVRDALIGAAPLLVGGLFAAFIGIYRLELNTLWESTSAGKADTVRLVMKTILEQPDFWLWFYLTFTISSTMMPSRSDRKAWLPFIATIVITSGLVLLVGAGQWMFSNVGSIIESALNAIIIVFGITIIIHLFLVPPVWLIRRLISRITGYQVV